MSVKAAGCASVGGRSWDKASGTSLSRTSLALMSSYL